MAVRIIFEKKPFFKERYEHRGYTRKTLAVKSVQYENNTFESKDVDHSEYSLAVKGIQKNLRFTSTVPFSRLKTDVVSFSRCRLPWLVKTRRWGGPFQNAGLEDLCSAIVSAVNESGVKCFMVKCTRSREQKETSNYPVKHLDDTEYYEFVVGYQSPFSFHYYHFQTPYYPQRVGEIANLEYMIQLDALDLPIYTGQVTAPSIILAPDAQIDPLMFLLRNKGNYQRKRKRTYFDKKLTVSSNPYNPNHAGISKTVDGKKARTVTMIKNGVLLHLPLNREESKKAGQPYIPNAFGAFEVKGGDTPLETIIRDSRDALFIYELRGEVGDDGGYSGIIKNGFILRDGKFTGRLLNAPVFFNVFDIYNRIEDLSAERVSMGYFLAPYIKFRI